MTAAQEELEKKHCDLVAVRDISERTLDNLIEQSDVVFDEIAESRRELREKVMGIARRITITDDSSSKEIEAKVSLLSMTESILSASEKAFERRINIRQKQKAADAANDVGAVVLDVLSKLNLNDEYVPSKDKTIDDAAKAELDARFAALDNLDVDVKPGETLRSV